MFYAFAEKIVDGIYHQVDSLLVDEHIFYYVPVIVTSAKLYRLRNDVDIQAIRQSLRIEDIADEHNCLVLKNNIGIGLKRFNENIFQNFINEYGRDKLELKLNTPNEAENIDHLFQVLSNSFCPDTIIIINHSAQSSGFDKLFKFIENMLSPTKEIINLIKKRRTRI